MEKVTTTILHNFYKELTTTQEVSSEMKEVLELRYTKFFKRNIIDPIILMDIIKKDMISGACATGDIEFLCNLGIDKKEAIEKARAYQVSVVGKISRAKRDSILILNKMADIQPSETRQLPYNFLDILNTVDYTGVRKSSALAFSKAIRAYLKEYKEEVASLLKGLVATEVICKGLKVSREVAGKKIPNMRYIYTITIPHINTKFTTPRIYRYTLDKTKLNNISSTKTSRRELVRMKIALKALLYLSIEHRLPVALTGIYSMPQQETLDLLVDHNIIEAEETINETVTYAAEKNLIEEEVYEELDIREIMCLPLTPEQATLHKRLELKYTPKPYPVTDATPDVLIGT